VDNAFKGAIRQTGLLVIEGVSAGLHDLSIDPPDAESFSQKVLVREGRLVLDLRRSKSSGDQRSSPLVGAIREAVVRKRVLEPDGAMSLYDRLVSESPREPQRRAIETLLIGALEEIGQQAINEYVHSSVTRVQAGIFRRGATALNRLMALRGDDSGLEARYLFCHGRALIVEGRATEAIEPLRRAVTLDPKAAYAHNALGLAYEHADSQQEALASFKRAADLASSWMVPRLHLGIIYHRIGQTARAESELLLATEMDPAYPLPRVLLARIAREKGRLDEAEKIAAAAAASSPQYPPVHAELGVIYDLRGEHQKALRSFDLFLRLAGDRANVDGYSTDEVRRAADRLRRTSQPPSLKRKPPG
jgi:Flp pilus assembly protein TadD